jgi:hypothetical protein
LSGLRHHPLRAVIGTVPISLMPSRAWIWIAAIVGGLIAFDGSSTLLERFLDDERLASGVGVGVGVAAATFIARTITRKLAARRRLQDR